MTITNWYKWADDYNNALPEARPLVIPGFDRLDDRLHAVIREQDAQAHFPKRKLAGGGGGQKRKKSKKSKKFKRMFWAPRLLEYQKLYAENLKDLQRCAFSQSNGYKFRSRPMPDFERCHQRLQKKYLNLSQNLSKPKCPSALATSLEALSRRNKKKIKSKQLANMPKINPCSSIDYMLRQPFKPLKTCSFTRPKPFNLCTTQRALGRFVFDEGRRVRMKERLEKLADNGFKSEQMEYLKQRKMTNFKANPNPWRRTKLDHRDI